MARIYTRSTGVKPVGFETWAQAKAFWFGVLGYRIYVPEVRDFHASNARTRIVEAFARAGKSYSAAHDVIPYAMPVRPMYDALIWLIGPNFRGNREFKDVFEILVDRRDELRANGVAYEIERAVNRPSAGDMEIRIVKDRDAKGRVYRSTILGLSAENEKMLQGEEVTYACQSEAAEQPETIYAKYLQSRCGWIVEPTTPKSARGEWLRALSESAEGRSEELNVEVFRYRHHRLPGTDAQGRPRLYCANPTYDYDRYWEARSAAVLRARRRLGPRATASDDPSFAQEFEGRWTYWSGRVLPFDRAVHVVPQDAFGDLRQYAIGAGFDYGFSDPSVCGLWATLPGPVHFLFDEVYQSGLTSERLVAACQDLLEKHDLEANVYAGDPRKPEVERVLRDAGLPVFAIDKNAQSDRAAGYRRLEDLLSEGPYEGFPGLYVADTCRRTIAEWETLHFRDGYRGEYAEGSLQGADHAADMARYYLMTRPSPRAPVRRAEHPIDRFRREQRAQRAAQRYARLGAHRYAQ